MKFVFFILVTILSTTHAFGSETAIDQSQFLTSRTSLDFREQSASIRERKSFSVTAQPIGIAYGPGAVVSQGLSLGYFLNGQSLLSIEGTYGKASDSGIFGPNFDSAITSFGMSYKRFFGNSFYIKGGIDYLQIRSTGYYPAPWFSNQNSSSGQIQGNAVAAELAVGNQWQWSVFTIGCDWVGFVKPFISNITQDDLSSGAPDNDRAEQNSENDRLFTAGILQFGRLYLGASF